MLMASELDSEPNVIKGATLPELFIIGKFLAFANFMFGVLISLLLAPGFIVLITLVFIFLGTFAGLWIAAAALRPFKRDKPPGYFMQKVELFMFKFMGKTPSFCQKSGQWR